MSPGAGGKTRRPTTQEFMIEAKLRILFVEGEKSHRHLLRELVEAGAHGFIGKTAPLSELQKGLEIVATGGTYFSPEVAEVLRQSMFNPAFSGTPPLQRLTAREREVLALLVEGLTNPEIAVRLTVSRSTARAHVSHILSKLDVSNRAEAVALALKQGLVK